MHGQNWTVFSIKGIVRCAETMIEQRNGKENERDSEKQPSSAIKARALSYILPDFMESPTSYHHQWNMFKNQATNEHKRHFFLPLSRTRAHSRTAFMCQVKCLVVVKLLNSLISCTILFLSISLSQLFRYAAIKPHKIYIFPLCTKHFIHKKRLSIQHQVHISSSITVYHKHLIAPSCIHQ